MLKDKLSKFGEWLDLYNQWKKAPEDTLREQWMAECLKAHDLGDVGWMRGSSMRLMSKKVRR